MNRTVPFFFDMIDVGAAHSERLTFRNTPMLHKRSTSVRKVCSWILVLGMHEHGKASRLVEALYRTPRDSRTLRSHQTTIRICE